MCIRDSYHPVLDLSPFDRLRVADYGDLPVNPISIEDTFHRITAGLTPVLQAGTVPMCVGGDHSILLPILRAMHAAHGPVGLIQLDAHSDTWDQYWGMKYSHGTPVRRAIEEGLLAEPYILQIGLRGQLYDANDMDFAREHKIMLVTAEEFHEHGLPLIREKLEAFKGLKTYLSLDIDVVDPAFAPGTGTPTSKNEAPVQTNSVGADFFETMGIAVLEGRSFNAHDLSLIHI